MTMNINYPCWLCGAPGTRIARDDFPESGKEPEALVTCDDHFTEAFS